jgi:hypothetical protein
MGPKASLDFGPLGFDPSRYKKVVLVRGVKGRSWLCQQLRDHGCDCLDVNQFVADNDNPTLSHSENMHNLEQKFKEISAFPSKALVLISDKLIQSRTALGKFFIELDARSLEKAFRRGHMMNVNRIQGRAGKLMEAIRTGALADIDKAFEYSGFDRTPTLDFTGYMLAYNRAKTNSEDNGYTVRSCQAIRHEIEKICAAS